MISKTSEDYISNIIWLRDAVKGQNLILKNVSALEYLQLFSGYMKEKEIDVYAKSKGRYDNINYCVVENFDGIDFIKDGDVMCSSFNQAINDMLDDFDNTDEQALAESLSNYYYSNNRSFDGLNIKPNNIQQFNYIKEWAVEYYNEG